MRKKIVTDGRTEHDNNNIPVLSIERAGLIMNQMMKLDKSIYFVIDKILFLILTFLIGIPWHLKNDRLM